LQGETGRRGDLVDLAVADGALVGRVIVIVVAGLPGGVVEGRGVVGMKTE
jgi:hypothetical protein